MPQWSPIWPMWTIGLGEVPTKYVVAISSTESGAELHLELIASIHHGGPSQKFHMRMWANLYATPVIIVSEVDGKVWELDQGTFTWGPDLNESDSQPKLRLSGAKINVKANNV